MSKGFRNRKKERRDSQKGGLSPSRFSYLETCYKQGRTRAENSDYAGARLIFGNLIGLQLPPRLGALVHNDLGTLDFLEGELAKARDRFERALTCDPNCQSARQNLELLEREVRPAAAAIKTDDAPVAAVAKRNVRVAIVSMLFNWPSTGGGTVHTAEAGKFLSRAGYDVKHFYAQFADWGIGNVTLPLDHPAVPLAFAAADWNASEIQRRFREAVDLFSPDYVIITDSWNFKPLLAEALTGYKYFLRLAAQECLCPLNNVRLLVDDQGNFSACPRNQLATADICRQCVSRNQQHSGGLHQAERALSGYGTAEYDQRLRRAFAEAEGVLAVNPLIAAAVGPHVKAVHVVPSGFDPDRFPSPWPQEENGQPKTKTTIFFAGIVEEYMKGFHVLHAACAKLWQKRQDFELVATADPPISNPTGSNLSGQTDPMTRFIGWQSQSELPGHLRRADFLVFPTIAEEALGRSAVEAMGVGRPVIASRIGGLPFTVTENLTGLLFEPGNVDDLAGKIELLLDDPALRERMGNAARQRFVEQYTWEAIIERNYRNLLKPIESHSAISIPADSPELASPAADDPDQFLAEVSQFFGMARPEVERMFAAYNSMRERQTQAAVTRKSARLNPEQGFLICLLLSVTRPATVVVAGGASESGDKIQALHDLRSLVGLDCKVIQYDDGQEAVSRPETEEFDAMPGLDADEMTAGARGQLAATGSFPIDILDRYGSGLICVPAGSTSEDVVAATCRHFGQWSLVAEGGPQQQADVRDVAARNGLEGLDFAGTPTDQANATHRIKLFSGEAGLTVIVPKALAAAPP